jgi:hypothetical protein
LVRENAIDQFVRIAMQMAADRGSYYLPAPRVLLRLCGLGRNVAIERVGQQYRAYQRAHEAQGGTAKRTHGNRAFRAAVRMALIAGRLSQSADWGQRNASILARQANVDDLTALQCLRGASFAAWTTGASQNDGMSPLMHNCPEDNSMSNESDARAQHQAKIREVLMREFWMSAESQEELERLSDLGVDRKVCTKLARFLVPIGYLSDKSVGILYGAEARLILRLCWAYGEAAALFENEATASMWMLANVKHMPSDSSSLMMSLASADEVIGRIRRGCEFIL